AFAGGGPPGGPAHDAEGDAAPAARRARARSARRLRLPLTARAVRPVPAHRARPAGPEVRALERSDAATAPGGGGRTDRHLQRAAPGGHPRPAPLRRVRYVRGAVRGPGLARSAGPGDQADP